MTSPERSDILPNVPPISDTLPGYETSSFYGVGVRAAPRARSIDLLNREINAALADTAIKQQIDELGAISNPWSFEPSKCWPRLACVAGVGRAGAAQSR